MELKRQILTFIVLVLLLFLATNIAYAQQYPNNQITKYNLYDSDNAVNLNKAALTQKQQFTYEQKLKFNTLEQIKAKNIPVIGEGCRLVKTYKGFHSSFTANSESYTRYCDASSNNKINYYSIPDKRQVLVYNLDVGYW
jgi:hypothetical protein